MHTLLFYIKYALSSSVDYPLLTCVKCSSKQTNKKQYTLQDHLKTGFKASQRHSVIGTTQYSTI